MTITFFNNWKTGIEFILIEMSFHTGAFTVALLGFGMVIIID